MKRASNARNEYRSDCERDWIDKELCVSADLMKVIVLPILPHKVCIFTPRLIAFNETFSILNGTKRKSLRKQCSSAFLWHEGIAAREAKEISSYFWQFFSINSNFEK